MTSLARLIGLFALAFSIGYTQAPGPVGLITEAAGTTITRAGLQDVGVPAYKGDLIFPGDTLTQSASGQVVFSFCPTSVLYSSGAGEIKVTESSVVKNGKNGMLQRSHLAVCRLPVVSPETHRDLRTAADRIQVASRIGAPVQLSAAQKATVEPLNVALARNPAEIVTLLARAIALEGFGDYDGAVRDYQAISKLAPDAHWIDDEVRAVLAQRKRIAQGEGRIIGVVIGISDYSKLGPEDQLQFADKDAEYFYRYLLSPRGGARAADVYLLLNDRAKLGDIKIALASAFAKANRNDSVVLFIAAHGVPTADGANRGAYIMAYDSSREELAATALRMEALQEVSDGKLRPQRIQMFVDACYSGLIGEIDRHRFNLFAADFLDKHRPDNQVLGLLASGRKEPSYECSNFDHGHGAFTYFLIHGLNASTGEAIDEARGQITVDSLFEYVRSHVREATKDQKLRQNPEKKGNIDDRVELVDKKLEGLQLPDTAMLSGSCDSARGRAVRTPISPQLDHPDPFTDALQKRRILPGVAGSAFDLLSEMRTGATSEEYNAARNKLLAALIDDGQEVILQYLRGEQVHMTREDFARGEKLFEAAGQLLAGGDSFLEARRLFCKGRRLIFERNLDAAIGTLREAIRLDLFGAYSYNALGIAFLEHAEFKQGISAFQDAIRLAPYWAYARHNLALAYMQDGQYTPAIAAYRDGMQLGPEYSYIPFNLGLLFERLNRPIEARELWQEVLKSSPKMTRAWNAIGVSYFLEHRFDKAEAAYRTALSMADDETDRLAVRHDLALLLKDRSRLTEAVALWRLNLHDRPEDLPSLVGLSDALVQQGDNQGALQTLSELVQRKPDYAGARLQYAKLLVDAGKAENAAQQLKEILKALPHSADANEMLGDLQFQGKSASNGNAEAALQSYQRALDDASSTGQRRRIQQKMRSLRVH